MPLNSHIALENIPAGQAYCSCLFAWRRPSKSIYSCIFTPAGKAMFQILRIFAEFEPSIIQERVRADLARAIRDSRQGYAGERHRRDEGCEDARRRRCAP